VTGVLHGAVTSGSGKAPVGNKRPTKVSSEGPSAARRRGQLWESPRPQGRELRAVGTGCVRGVASRSRQPCRPRPLDGLVECRRSPGERSGRAVCLFNDTEKVEVLCFGAERGFIRVLPFSVTWIGWRAGQGGT